MSVTKSLLAAACVLLLLYSLFAWHIWHAMRQSPEVFGGVMAHMPVIAYFLVPFETMWLHARAGHLQEGDPAPDFYLSTIDKSSSVQLSALTAKQPVVLIFGSYT